MDAQLYRLSGGADLATPGLVSFSVPVSSFGSPLPGAVSQADQCLTATAGAHPYRMSVPDVTSDSYGLRVSGAITGTATGSLSCVLNQIQGSLPLGKSTLTLGLNNIFSATIAKPPGGALLWVFQADPSAPITGIRLGSHAAAFHVAIPYDNGEALSGGGPPSGSLRLDGVLPCH